MKRHLPSNRHPPNTWRRFHKANPYQDKEEARSAERAKEIQQAEARRKALQFANKDPERKTHQIIRGNQTHRAKYHPVSLPPPFPGKR